MQVHVIHEIDCSVERIDPAVVEAFLDAELSDDPMPVSYTHLTLPTNSLV